MFSFLAFLFRLIFHLFESKKRLLVQVSLQQKELEILKRHHRKKRVRFRHSDRIILSILHRVGHIRDHLSIVKPETVLGWQRQLIKQFWTFKRKKRVGRPPVSHEIKQLILSMKNDNLFWGNKKIQGELLKLDIRLDKNTIRNMLIDFRRKDKIRQSLTWKQFLSVQIHSFYAMDFFTIDTYDEATILCLFYYLSSDARDCAVYHYPESLPGIRQATIDRIRGSAQQLGVSYS